MRFVNLAVALASGFAVTAFSLDKRAGAVVASSKPSAWKALPSKQTNALLLKQSQIFASGRDDFPGANVAAKETQGKEKKHLGSIWNDNTKLAFNLAVWYLGNIYCKQYQCIIVWIMIPLTMIRLCRQYLQQKGLYCSGQISHRFHQCCLGIGGSSVAGWSSLCSASLDYGYSSRSKANC